MNFEAWYRALTPRLGSLACADFPLNLTTTNELPRCPKFRLRFVLSVIIAASPLSPSFSTKYLGPGCPGVASYITTPVPVRFALRYTEVSLAIDVATIIDTLHNFLSS